MKYLKNKKSISFMQYAFNYDIHKKENDDSMEKLKNELSRNALNLEEK